MGSTAGRIGLGVATMGGSEVVRAAAKPISSKGDNAERKFQEQLAGLDPGEKPSAPSFSNLLDPNTGRLKDQYNLRDASAWRQASLGKLGQEELAGRDLAQQMGQTQAAQARSNLASRAGLSGGAAERLAAQGARSTAEQQQMATRQGAQNRAGLEVQTEGLNRQADQYNIGNALNEQKRQDDLKQQQYAQQMQQYAAAKQAQGILQAGQGKGQGGGFSGGVTKTLGK